MKERVSPWLFVAILSVVATGVLATLLFFSAHQQKADRAMLRALLDREVGVTARKVFKAEYDPKDGRWMSRSEIDRFLSDRKVSVETLPPGLQRALSEKRAFGLSVSFSESEGPGKPRKLSPRARMLLAWEMSLNGGGGGGGGMIWFNGSGGGGQETCALKCASYPDCCVPTDGLCFCVGYYKCPPCDACTRCGGGSVSVK